MSTTTPAEIAPETAERLEELAQAQNLPAPQLAGRAVEEFVRSSRFPGIVFTTGGSGRRKAALLGGVAVWSVIFIARCYAMDVAKTAAHLEISERAVKLALAYYEAYPDEIDERLQEMEAVDQDPTRLHPRVEVLKAADVEQLMGGGGRLWHGCASPCSWHLRSPA